MNDGFSRMKLGGGAELLTVPMTETGAAVILVSVKVGSRHEREEEHGLSHFLEHMFFKGSARFPNMRSLAAALDGLGAEFNAWTGKEITEYYIKVPAEELLPAIKIMADLFLKPTFPEAEFAKEQGVILQEISMVEDTPERYVEDLMEAVLYEGQPLGRLVLGTRETVRSFSRAKLMAYQSRHYVPERTLITLAGRLTPASIEAASSALDYSRPCGKESEGLRAPPDYPRVVVRAQPTEQAHLSLGFLGYRFDHPKRTAAKLLALILGGTASSRLFHEVREERGLGYYIRAHAHSYSDTGYLEVHAGLDPKRLPEALHVILKECRQIRETRVTSQELTKAKRYAKGRLLLSLEQSDAVADYYATQVLLGHAIQTPAELVREIEAVSAGGIQEVAEETFRASQAALAAIGQQLDEGKIRKELQAL